jgi:hypothetical protein
MNAFALRAHPGVTFGALRRPTPVGERLRLALAASLLRAVIGLLVTWRRLAHA